MFTEKELTEIVEAHEAVYKAIRPCFGNVGTEMDADQRAAEVATTRIVAAKIIADGAKCGHIRRTF